MARKRKYILPASLGALVQEYRASPEFDRLAAGTKVGYQLALDRLSPLYRVRVDEIRRRHIIALRNKYRDKPGAANAIVAVVGVLMKLAVVLEYRESGISGVEKLPVGERRRWSDQDIAAALETFPEHLRRAVVLALYTGQRSGDLAAMTWSAYDGDGITVTQQKTGVQLWLPAHPALKKELDAWRLSATAVSILTTASGLPLRNHALKSLTYREIKRHPELRGLVFHGLRMTAAAKLAEAGCSVHEIASITGHKSLQMIEHYTAGADQKKRAKAAIYKLQNKATY
tara:strand:+ start:55 stop:912 length:858 start_codon:yes stop_codon:yes gene_type:complete